MIQINNLSFGYNKKHLLYNGLNLRLEEGTIYGLLGKNGAGKSTLLKLLSGMLFPKQGTLRVNGFEPQKRNPNFLSDLYFIPEEVEVPALSIKKYLDLYGPFYPYFKEKELYVYLDHLEVNHIGKLSELSFGQQKKFIIAFALACNTKIIFMDEPTNGLDIPSKSWFRKLISMAVNEQRTILISTHQVRDLENLIDSVVIIEEGKVLLQHSIQAISEKLVFKTGNEIELSEADLLFSEKALIGYSTVSINNRKEESKVNLEHLFEACMQSSEKILSIFQNPS